MRKIIYNVYVGIVLMIVLLIQVGLFKISSSASAETNLIANPSLETADSTGQGPLYWQKNSWGSNTATFSYENTGYNSTRSVKVKVTNYVDGDAKWYFDPITVEPDGDYIFSDYYISNVDTAIVAMSLDESGNPTYLDLGSLSASTTWTRATVKFHTLSNTKQITVFHLLAKNGSLSLDQASLTATTPITITDFVPNNSLEQSSDTDPNMPAGWQKGQWGTNTPTFEYINEGHTGSKSVKVTMTNYQSGDAKWYFNPQPLIPGQAYRFSAYYKTNTIPHVVAMFILNDGSEKFFGMPSPQPNGSTDWQHYSDTFIVPLNAQSVSVFFFLVNNGWVQSDDYKLEAYQPTGFNRPLVTLTFDDGFETNVSTALPKLNTLGFKSTQFYATTYVEGKRTQERNVLKFKNAGHEIGSHSVTHPFLTQVSASTLDYELSHSQTYLKNLTSTSVLNFASPYGDYNTTVNNAIKKYYRSHRTVDEGYNSKDNFDPYKVRVQNMQVTTTLAEYQSWLDKAKADKTWLVIVYHRISNNNPGQFDTKTADFDKQMSALKNSGITVKTYNAALDEITSQLP